VTGDHHGRGRLDQGSQRQPGHQGQRVADVPNADGGSYTTDEDTAVA
jgi:hypothetical protein